MMLFADAQRLVRDVPSEDVPILGAAVSSFIKLRDELNGTAAITRRTWRAEFGGRMVTLLRFADAIELFEGTTATSDEPTATAETTNALPISIEALFDGLKTAVSRELLSVGVAEHKRFQALAIQEKARADARLEAATKRIDNVEESGRDAGSEASGLEGVDEELAKTKKERDETVDQAQATATAHAVDRARLAAAEAQIITYQRTEEQRTQEFGQLLAERDRLIQAADRGHEAKADLARTREQRNRAEAEIGRLKSQIIEMGEAHTQAMVALREDLEAQLQTQTLRAEALEAGLMKALHTAVNGLDRPEAQS